MEWIAAREDSAILVQVLEESIAIEGEQRRGTVRETDRLVVSGAVLFAAGAAIVLVALTRGGENLVATGLVGLVGAVVCLAIGSRRMHTQVDWKRVESEQRLWESGPLGRTWLRIRKALFDRR